MRAGGGLVILLLWIENLHYGQAAEALTDVASTSSSILKLKPNLESSSTLKNVGLESDSGHLRVGSGSTSGVQQMGRPLEDAKIRESNIPTRPASAPVEQSSTIPDVESYCDRVHGLKRRQVLVRRGCIRVAASVLRGSSRGLAAVSRRLNQDSEKLMNFDRLPRHVKLDWLKEKVQNGLWYTGIGALITVGGPVAVGVAAAGVAVAVPIVTVGGLSWLGYKIIARLGLNTWRLLGKGLAGTGRGLQKAGSRMQGMKEATQFSGSRTVITPPATLEPAHARETIREGEHGAKLSRTATPPATMQPPRAMETVQDGEQATLTPPTSTVTPSTIQPTTDARNPIRTEVPA
ncbi:hypothetical protein PCASD_24438 [Puccinia coronata f. sp. avenae]|uniref:Transmembrane protein n=1 Tax=Puccinia coronata f. sp. avenae TaxID=200324 RepID=A0A2N5S0R0_9BASI|nr:hypothetical protein PCASD_24438 [Puccinia coronata f. sp. avenae]